MIRLNLILFFIFFIFIGRAFAVEQIDLLTYHNHPPFITKPNQGLTYDLASFLNESGKKRYHFNVKVLPRKRLNLQITESDAWIVLWGNPLWFGDKNETAYKWIKILEDENAIISLMDNKVEYNDPESLIGHDFGGIRGHRYVGIDNLVKDGLINRINGDHEKNLLRVLLAGRLDVILLPKSTILYFMKTMDLESTVYIASNAHQKYWRNLMVPHSQQALQEFLQSLSLIDNSKFKNIKSDYRL